VPEVYFHGLARLMKGLPARIIDTYEGLPTGPLVVAMGGIHGNEPAGIQALQRVFAYLHEHKVPFAGRFVGLRGNLKAISLRERFLHSDLNRMWDEGSIQKTREKSAVSGWDSLHQEEQELLELLEQLRPLHTTPYLPKVMLDLHTTSAPGGHFSVVETDALTLDIAETLGAPVIMGLTKALKGTTASYCVEQGWSGLAFEAGQHHDPNAITDHAAAIWGVLYKAGCLPYPEKTPLSASLQHLAALSSHLPQFVKVVYRHAITPADKFSMKPGYINFQQVEKGELLGWDEKGEVRCPAEGLILMPLYQPQGADGFFIIQSVERPILSPAA